MKKIFYNGKVFTGALPLVSAFSVEDGKFLLAGNDQEVLALAEAADELTDLSGRFVCCGFNDSHMHLLNLGYALSAARLDLCTGSLQDMISGFRAFAEAEENKNASVLLGRGWNQDLFTDTDKMPDRWDLDRVSENRPAVAVRACGHMLSVNSAFLKLFSEEELTDVDGGIIERINGEPTGIFCDNAMELVYARIPAPSKEEIKRMLLAGSRFLNSFGVTSCQTDDLAAFSGVPYETVLEAYRELTAEGKLTVRVYEQSNFSSLEDFSSFLSNGYRTGTGDTRFRIGPLKLLSDGALGPRTALLSVPYADRPDTKGLACFSQELLDDMISLANRNGMQIAVHAIGDGALDMLLSAYEKALKEHPSDDHRHGVVHCQITRKDQLEKIASLGLHVYAQGIFLDYDAKIVHERVGNALADTSYRWKTLMKMGVRVSNGTDSPVELPDALKCMQLAVTRQPVDRSTPPYLPEEAFTVEEALQSYTSAGAYASFEENIKGEMLPGMLADFTVLEESPFDISSDRIRNIPVLSVYLGGNKVWQR